MNDEQRYKAWKEFCRTFHELEYMSLEDFFDAGYRAGYDAGYIEKTYEDNDEAVDRGWMND